MFHQNNSLAVGLEMLIFFLNDRRGVGWETILFLNDSRDISL